MSIIYNSEGHVDIATMRTNGTLPHEAYIKWDQRMVDVARDRLTIVQDLNSFGLVNRGYNLGDIVAKYEKLSDMDAAVVNMDGVTPASRDRVTYTEAGVPIPIFSKNFQLNERQIQAALNKNHSLSNTMITTSTRRVADSINNMIFNGLPGFVTVDGLQVEGLSNAANGTNVPAAAAWGAGGQDPVGDVENLLAAAYAANFFGPFNLYVSKDHWAFIQGDYSANKGEKTYKERFESFSDINEVRPGDQLAPGSAILVNMSDETIELKVGQDFVNFEQPQTNRMQHDFTVMAAMVICIKSDANNRCGVVRLTGS